ncbi:MAG: HAD hydrolase family protein [Patescibacteria group bacterium]
MKNLEEMTKEELDKIKVVTFDIDGVIAPTGTEIREENDGAKLCMESKPLSEEFIQNLNKLEKKVRLNFSSGRNILYLKSLVNKIFDKQTILQAENGNITWFNNQISHPVYEDSYFDKLRELKERMREMKKNDPRIRGFEPKLFILTVHCEEMEEIPNLVKEIAGDNLYCLWTNEGYDIGSRQVSKGKAIEDLANKLKIKPKQIITTGNNYNDEEMLQVGKGVTVDKTRVQAEYYVEPRDGKLGGEILAEFLLEHL